MTLFQYRVPMAVLAALPVLLLASAAPAQENGNFLDNLFNRGGEQQSQQPAPMPAGNDAGVSARLDRIEHALRQLTGTVEELQHQNQLLQTQVQQMSGRGYSPQPQPQMQQGQVPQAPTRTPYGGAPTDEHGDAFNPALHPNAPGVPRPLSNELPGRQGMNAPVGVPGGREAGTPLDLTSLAPNGSPAPVAAPATEGVSGALPPPPPRSPSATGVKLATLPPSASPRDEYELAYGYVLHKDYGLATQAFRDFLRRHPQDRLVPDAQYWLGESLYQQQNYDDAARAFLTISTKYTKFAKAPEALLRLGQSLSAMHHKDAACATLGEVTHKYPHASASVKRNVAQELKRAHC